MLNKSSLPYQHGSEEKIIGNFSLRQGIWVLGGAYIIYVMASNGILLPFPFPFSVLHFLPIIVISMIGAYLQYKGDYATNYFMRWLDCRTRNRVFVHGGKT